MKFKKAIKKFKRAKRKHLKRFVKEMVKKRYWYVTSYIVDEDGIRKLTLVAEREL